MPSTSAYVYDVSDEQFEQAVLVRSRSVPVLVDFWATWCGPCQVLGPTLETLANTMDGVFELAKIDVDKNPLSASTFGVRGIPHVVLFKGGKRVDQFVGVRSEADVRAFLRPHCPSPADEQALEGLRLLEADNATEARNALEAAIAAQPQHAGAHLGLAKLALREGDFDAVDTHVHNIPGIADEREAGNFLMQAVELARSVSHLGTDSEVTAQAATQADSFELRFAVGVHHLIAGRYREALDALLALAQDDRKWRDEMPRKAMLTAFGIIGIRHPLSDEYRKQLMFIY